MECNNTDRRMRSSYTALVPLALSALFAASPLTAHASVIWGESPTNCDAATARVLAAPSPGSVSVIATCLATPTTAQEAQIVALDGDIYGRFPLIHAIAVRLPAKNAAKLAALSFVKHLSSDSPVKKNDAFTVGSSGADHAFAVGDNGDAYTLTGQGVTVAVLDSGVQKSEDLKYPG